MVNIFGIEIAFDEAHWKNSKYLCIVVFGYTLHHFWGKLKPQLYLKWMMWICLPFLFGCIGASI